MYLNAYDSDIILKLYFSDPKYWKKNILTMEFIPQSKRTNLVSISKEQMFNTNNLSLQPHVFHQHMSRCAVVSSQDRTSDNRRIRPSYSRWTWFTQCHCPDSGQQGKTVMLGAVFLPFVRWKIRLTKHQ